MKTTYQKPEIKVITVAQHLMNNGASSLDKKSSTISDNDAVLSREQYSLWDDDEEE